MTGAGVAVALLPLGLGRGSVGAAAVGVVTVAAWAWGTGSGRRVGLAVGGVLISLMVAVFAVSQWPSALISAPSMDWLVGWLLIAGGCLAALLVDRISHRPGRQRAEPSAPALRRNAVVWVLAVVLLLCDCGVGVLLSDGDGRLRFAAGDDEVLPLPSTLRLVSADSCAAGGSSGNCTAEFVISTTDGASRPTVVVRLVDHLQRRGWRLVRSGTVYESYRETGGILPWAPHHLWLYADEEPDPPADTIAVTVYIDNL